MLSHELAGETSIHFERQTFFRTALTAFLTIVLACAGCTMEMTIPSSAQRSDEYGLTLSAGRPRKVASDFATLEDYWNGTAEFALDVADTGLPMGESDTVILEDGRYRSYVHASHRSLGVVDQCGDHVNFPGCVVAFESVDHGRTFAPARKVPGPITCLIPCRTCPCESRRDHVDQQQYPRVVRIPKSEHTLDEWWAMVYEYRGSVFVRTSVDGLAWSSAAQLAQTGTWKTWLMPCRTEESIGPHPHAQHEYDCLVGGPPGIATAANGTDYEVYLFAALGQNPGSMGCYRGNLGGALSVLRKCDTNPLFTGSQVYGEAASPGAQANRFFDFRTISSAEVLHSGGRYYMLYEGVRGPSAGDAGDTQFALGLARSVSDEIDGAWETYQDNPILRDVPGNIGIGHADVLTDAGMTILYTSLDGESRSRLVLRWK